MTLLGYVDTGVVKITRFGVILGMVILFVLLMIRIIARATEIPFVAFDEIGELATVYMILFGVVAMWRAGTLYCVDFTAGSTHRAALVINLVIQFVMLAFALVLIWQGGKFTLVNRENSAFLLINMDYYYGAIPTAATVMGLYSVVSIWRWAVAVVTGKPPYHPKEDTGGTSSGHL